MRLKLSGVVVVKHHVPRTTTTAIKSKGQRREALAQWHVSSVGSAISVVVVVFFLQFQSTTSTPSLLQLNPRSSSLQAL